uniref:thymus-specific serine protease-like n=1 Tax=Myxine glutinosa TaxID=7769 RepID=UPI00358EA12B
MRVLASLSLVIFLQVLHINAGRHFWRITDHVHRLRLERQRSYVTKTKLWNEPLQFNRAPIAEFLKQPLDHFDRQCRKSFEQRFWVNTAFWKQPYGPVFLLIGGEASLSEYDVLSGEHVDLATKFGALVVAAEHRFYGESICAAGLEMSNLQYLSSQQALADLAVLHANLSHRFNLPRNHTWISFGGSYPGSLSAWFRLKFPHLVFAAVASSAPVRAQLDFQDYNKVVANSLSDPMIGGSKECLANVRSAFSTLGAALEKGMPFVKHVAKDFKTCTIPNSLRDKGQLVASLADIFMGAVQYNGELAGINVADLCSTMVNSTTSPYGALQDVANQYLERMELPCLDIDFVHFLKFLSNTTSVKMIGIGERQWYFQTCTEFGYYQTCNVSLGCPFSKLMSLDDSLVACSKVFGVETSEITFSVAFTNEFYGAAHPRGSRILFVNGDIDPWHALSILRNETISETAIYIRGTAHCANMLPPSDSDPRTLRLARQKIEAQVGAWLKKARLGVAV